MLSRVEDVQTLVGLSVELEMKQIPVMTFLNALTFYIVVSYYDFQSSLCTTTTRPQKLKTGPQKGGRCRQVVVNSGLTA